MRGPRCAATDDSPRGSIDAQTCGPSERRFLETAVNPPVWGTLPRWLPRLLRHIDDLAGRGQVRFTPKARELAALGAGLGVEDACDVLAALTVDDFAERVDSDLTGEWMYIFKPAVAGTVVYLEVVVRTACVIVSFHEDEGDR